MKLKLRYVNNNDSINEVFYPETVTDQLRRKNATEIDSYAFKMFSVSKSIPNGKVGILGMNNQDVSFEMTPNALNLAEIGHKETIQSFAGDDNTSAKYTNTAGRVINLKGLSLSQLLTIYKVKLDGQGKIPLVNLPDIIKGQMKYKESISLNLSTPTKVSSITTFQNLANNTTLRQGDYVITSTEGFLSFDSGNVLMSSGYIEEEEIPTDLDVQHALNWEGVVTSDVPYEALNWDSLSGDNDVVGALSWVEDFTNTLHVSAGSFILFVKRESNVNYYAIIKRDVKPASLGRHGMVKLTGKNITGRSSLSSSIKSHEVITEADLMKVGFEINLTGQELIFESFE